MNRAERRKQKIPKGVTPIDLALLKKQAVDELMEKIDLESIKLEAAKEGARLGFESLICIPIWVAHNKMDWGKKRLTRFAEWLLETYDDYDKGLISREDLIDTLKEETGFEFKEVESEEEGEV